MQANTGEYNNKQCNKFVLHSVHRLCKLSFASLCLMAAVDFTLSVNLHVVFLRDALFCYSAKLFYFCS